MDWLPHPVNYLAVLVSGLAIFILGGLWYSKAMFATRWMALLGVPQGTKPARGLGGMLVQAFICGTLTSWVLAVLMNHFVNMTALRGALLGGMCWVGFAGVTAYANTLFSMRPRKLWLIDSGYNLVSFVIAGVILACWP